MPLSIDQIPIPVPSSTDPANFSARGDAVFGAFPDFIDQTNAVASEAAANRDSAEASKIAAANSETNAATYAVNATTSANNANSSSVASLWVSGTTYAINDKRVSPITGQVYRRKTDGAGTTDPSQDSTNWYAVLLDADTQYPTIRPTLNLDFANSGKLDPRITFTRASVATYYDKLGVLRTASNNEPRFDYDPVTLEAKGLLIEESRQNLLTYSEQLDNAAWAKGNTTVSTNAVTAPDGATTADKLLEFASTAQHTVSNFVIATATAGTAYTATCFIKAAERNYAFFGITGTAVGVPALVSVNLLTGAVATVNGSPTSFSSTNAGNGWWRVAVSVTTAVTGDVIFDLRISADGIWANRSYAGNATSGIYVWGAQLEAGSFPTSYIPTTATAVTRQIDNAVMTGTNFSSWYNQSEGTFDCISSGFTSSSTGNARAVFGVSDGTSSNRIWSILSNVSGSNSSYFEINAAGVQQTNLGTGAPYTNSQRNIAFSYKADDVLFCRDSGTVQTDNTATIPSVNQLGIGSVYSSFPMNGWIRTLTYYPKRLPQNYQLQILTR